MHDSGAVFCHPFFRVVKVWNLPEFIGKWRFSMEMHVCLSLQSYANDVDFWVLLQHNNVWPHAVHATTETIMDLNLSVFHIHYIHQIFPWVIITSSDHSKWSWKERHSDQKGAETGDARVWTKIFFVIQISMYSVSTGRLGAEERLEKRCSSITFFASINYWGKKLFIWSILV